MSVAVDNSVQRRMAEVQTLVGQVEELAGSAAGEQVQRVLQLVMNLHGDALRRIMRQAKQAGPAGESLLAAMAADELVASVLLLHDLHPQGMEDRIRAAVEKVRPYLQSHGGDVELVGIAAGSANLRMQGSCGGCPAMTKSLRMVIEGAIYDAAPDLAGISIEAAAAE